MKKRLELTDADRDRMMEHVRRETARKESPLTRAQWDYSYQKWIWGGRAWEVMQEGGTGIMQILMWFHHIHKPGSAEWRPTIILRELFEVSNPIEAAAVTK